MRTRPRRTFEDHVLIALKLKEADQALGEAISLLRGQARLVDKLIKLTYKINNVKSECENLMFRDLGEPPEPFIYYSKLEVVREWLNRLQKCEQEDGYDQDSAV